jgi:ribosomal protein S21
MKENKYSKPFNHHSQAPVQTCITVSQDECRGDADKMVRKFCKKVKRSGVLEEARDRLAFKKGCEKNSERKAAKKRLIMKVNKKRDELLNFSARRGKRR